MFDSHLFTYIIIPLLIFLARVIDVTLGTIRVIFVSKGLKYLAPVIGFFEVLIWLMAIGQIMNNLSNHLSYIAYAGGFATGNYVGMIIAEKLYIGVVLLRVITQKDASELVKSLGSQKYGVTCVDGYGTQGKVNVMFTVVPKKEIPKVIKLVMEFNPKAFYTIEDVDFVEKGIFPVTTKWHNETFEMIFRPFRKGK
ncbi:MAG: DUF2179 domain-containing protein [Sedimentisphaerales bacterium]|nr:DUF2179 domain-containing protein [Sedimentisphaerales bacterium]